MGRSCEGVSKQRGAYGLQGARKIESSYQVQCLAAYTYPRVVEFIDALPKKGPTGKILKRELR
jgi:acyl-coenzyme A synthetase/AMP-(fatty) acid ligase